MQRALFHSRNVIRDKRLLRLEIMEGFFFAIILGRNIYRIVLSWNCTLRRWIVIRFLILERFFLNDHF